MSIPVYNPDEIQAFRKGSQLVVRSSTWAMNPRVSKSDFAMKFKLNPRVAMRDYASIPVTSLDTFFKDPSIFERRVNQSRRPPFVFDEHGNQVFAEWFYPGPWKYFLHGDLGIKRDAAGIAMSHLDTRRNVVVVDMIMTIQARPGEELRFDRFRQIIYTLQGRGFEIAKCTFDTWQSFETKQHLESRGFKVEFFSTDRTTKAADTIQELLLSNRLDFYYDETFFREGKELQLLEGVKVDHPEGGSKDTFDAVSASAFNALTEGGGIEQLLGFVAMTSNGIESSMTAQDVAEEGGDPENMEEASMGNFESMLL